MMIITTAEAPANRRIILKDGQACSMMDARDLNRLLASSIDLIRTTSRNGARIATPFGSADPSFVFLLYLGPPPAYIRQRGGVALAEQRAKHQMGPLQQILERYGLFWGLEFIHPKDATSRVPAGLHILVHPA